MESADGKNTQGSGIQLAYKSKVKAAFRLKISAPDDSENILWKYWSDVPS
jgi:hypothetical protein